MKDSDINRILAAFFQNFNKTLKSTTDNSVLYNATLDYYQKTILKITKDYYMNYVFYLLSFHL